ncbi:MAG TPA: hypothetical protein ENH35_03010 [Candidatus Moranbacteria bacterium]|nr:hypothetical protein [Candidatus Moranbacteria bacterium]
MAFDITRKKLNELQKSLGETKFYTERYQPQPSIRIENIASVRPEYEEMGAVDLHKRLQYESEDFSGPFGLLKEARKRPENFFSDWDQAGFINKIGMMSVEALQPGRARKEAPGKLISGAVELKNKPSEMIAGLSRKLGITKEGADPLQDLIDKRKRGEKIVVQSFVEGLTGGILKPETGEEAEGLFEKTMAGIAEGLGAVISIGKISTAWKTATVSQGALLKFLAKNEKLYEIISRSIPIMVYGQIDPDLEFDMKTRAKVLGATAIMGQAFGYVGGWKNAIASASGAGAVGAGISWLSGEDPEDILVSFLIFATMEAGFRYGFKDNPMFTKAGIERIFRKKAVETFDKYGSNIKEGSSLKAISKERKRLAKKYHPDLKTGNEKIMKEINRSFDILSKGSPEVVEKEEGVTFKGVIKRVSDLIKGKRVGNKYDGDVMEAKKVQKLLKEGEETTKSKLQVKIDEAKLKLETKKLLAKELELTVGITNATQKVPEIKAKLAEANELQKVGKFEQARVKYNEVLDMGEEAVKETLSTIKGVSFNIKKTIGNFFNETEPTYKLSVNTTNSRAREVIQRLSNLADTGFKQDNVHFSKHLTKLSKADKIGISDKDGWTIEPDLTIIFKKPISDKDFVILSKEMQKIGLAGSILEADNKGIVLYNISKFKNYEKFQKEIKQLENIFNARGTQAEFSEGYRRLLNAGGREGGATKEYSEIRREVRIQRDEPRYDKGIKKDVQEKTNIITKPKAGRKEKRVIQKGKEIETDYTRLVESEASTEQQLKQVIGDYLGEQKQGFFDVQKLSREITKSYSEAERKAAIFLREKTVLPKNISEIEKQSYKIEDAMDSPKAKELAVKMGKIMDKLHNKLQDVYEKDIGFVKDYITHIWQLEGKKAQSAEKYFTTHPKYLKKRSIATYKEGIEKGYIPKTLDIAEIARNYSELYVKAITNKKLVDTFLTMEVGGEKLVDGEQLDGYVLYDNPLFNKWRFIGKGEESILLAKKPIFVPKEAKPILDAVFEDAWRGDIIKVVETVNAIKKIFYLTGSAFHPIVLLEGSAANGILMKVVWETMNPYYIGKALLTGEALTKGQEVIARDGIRHGLQVEPLTDYQRHNVDKMFDGLHNFLDKENRKVIMNETDSTTGKVLTKTYDMVDVLGVPSTLIKPVTKSTHALLKANNWFLWDFLHLKIKTFAYEKLSKKHTKGVEDPAKIDKIKFEMAQLVNDQFGGQNWEMLGVSRKKLQAGRTALLSLDWTTSTTRQALAVTGYGHRFEETKKIRMKAAWAFWLRAALIIMGSVQIANYLFTKKEYGKGRTTFGNAPGHKMDLFIGRFVTGEEKYARTMKQFREMIELIEDPRAFFGRKTSPVIQDLFKQFSGYTPSGWKTEWAGSGLWETLGERSKDFFGIKPFGVRGYQETEELASFALPITKGMSNFRAKQLMVAAMKGIEKAQTEEGKAKAQEKLDNVIKHARQNALDITYIYNTAKREVELGDRDERRKHKLEAVKLLLEGGEKNKAKALELIKEYNLNITAVDIADIKKKIKLTK